MEVIAAAAALLGAVSGAGASYGATRSRINRADRDIVRLNEVISEHTEDDTRAHSEMVQRLTRIETIVERIDRKL